MTAQAIRSFRDKLATDRPEELIAEQVPTFTVMMRRHYPENATAFTTYATARANKARNAAVIEQLRTIWRKAHTGDPAWRAELDAFATTHRNIDQVSAKRWQLIAEQAGA